MSPSFTSTEDTGWNPKDWLIGAMLMLGSFLLYTLGRNVEFQGDDDYLYLRSFHMLHQAWDQIHLLEWRLLPAQLINFGIAFMSEPRHAPLPVLLNAWFYHGCVGLDSKFTLNVFHLPIALVSSTAIALFYRMIRIQPGTSRSIAVFGSLLLMTSPLFTMASRGLSSYYLAFIPFSTIIAMLSLQHVSRTGSVSIWTGLGTAQVVFSDTLWFVTLPLLLASFLWATGNWRTGLARLTSPALALPLGAGILFMIAGTISMACIGKSAPFLSLLHSHARSHGWNPVILDPHQLFGCLAMLAGAGTLGWLGLGTILWTWKNRRLPASVPASFAVLAFLAYATLFYVVSSETRFVKNFYQIYLVTPVVLLLTCMLSFISSRRLFGRLGITALALAILTTEVLACVNYVWKLPVSPAASTFADWAHGTNNPNQGTKAAGYLMRQWMLAAWKLDSRIPANITLSRYTVSLAIFSGIGEGERGDYFRHQTGAPHKITMKIDGSLPASFRDNHDRRIGSAIILDLSGAPRPDTPPYTYTLCNQGTPITVLLVYPPAGIATPPIKSGISDIEIWDKCFDQTYHAYSDFFPNP